MKNKTVPLKQRLDSFTGTLGFPRKIERNPKRTKLKLQIGYLLEKRIAKSQTEDPHQRTNFSFLCPADNKHS